MAILRNTTAFERASDLAMMKIAETINPATNSPWERGDDGYAEKVIEITIRFLRQLS